MINSSANVTCLLGVSLQNHICFWCFQGHTATCVYTFLSGFQADFSRSTMASYLSIHNRNVSSRGGLGCRSCGEDVETRISWRSHNLVLTVQAVMTQFGDPSIKPVLGFHLEQDARKDSCGNRLLAATGEGKSHPPLMPDAEANFTFR